MLFFRILLRIDLKSLSWYPEPNNSILISGRDSDNLANTEEITLSLPNFESSCILLNPADAVAWL